MKRKYKVNIFVALRKLWRLGRCNHMCRTECLVLGNTYELVFCKNCGRVLCLTGETQRKNKNYDKDRLEHKQ